MPSTSRFRGRHAAPGLLLAGYGLLFVAWLAGNPPGATPDEPVQYVKALATAGGDLVGRPGAYGEGSGLEAEQRVWINRSTRAMEVPRSLAPPSILTCNIIRPELSFACVDDVPHEPPMVGDRQLSYVGTYQPYLYVLPGAAARLGEDWSSGLLLARIASGVSCAALLVLALAVLWSPASGLSLTGLLMAVTPMTIFMGSSMTTSGTEIFGGLCLAAGVVGLCRSPDPPARAWAAVAAGGAVLALSRPLGPVWTLAHLAVVPATVGIRAAAGRLRAAGWWGRAAAGALAAGIAGGVGWELAVQPHPARNLGRIREELLPAVGDLPQALREQIGVFGWLDTEMPMPAYAAWRTALVVVVAFALLLGTRRQRLVLIGVALAAAGATVGVSAVIIRQTDFNMQGRYVLPFTLMVPLYAGEVLFQARHRLDLRRTWGLAPLLAGMAATVHFVGWFANARRYAVGNRGPILFIGRSEWSPMIGWWPWALCAALAALAIAGAGVAAGWWSDRGGAPTGGLSPSPAREPGAAPS